MLSQSLAAADIHYLGLARGLAGYVVPSRINGILAAGRPVIVAADPESESVQARPRCGMRPDRARRRPRRRRRRNPPGVCGRDGSGRAGCGRPRLDRAPSRSHRRHRSVSGVVRRAARHRSRRWQGLGTIPAEAGSERRRGELFSAWSSQGCRRSSSQSPSRTFMSPDQVSSRAQRTVPSRGIQLSMGPLCNRGHFWTSWSGHLTRTAITPVRRRRTSSTASGSRATTRLPATCALASRPLRSTSRPASTPTTPLRRASVDELRAPPFGACPQLLRRVRRRALRSRRVRVDEHGGRP